jgi:hypothetical protein
VKLIELSEQEEGIPEKDLLTLLQTVKVKVKLSLCFLTEHHTMKAYWESGGIAPLIL